MIEVTPTLDTNAFASGDVLFNGVVIPQSSSGGLQLLQQVAALDESDQGVTLTLFFAVSAITLGTVNAAPNLSDSTARDLRGQVQLATANWYDLGGCKLITATNLGLILPPGPLYVAATVDSGTPTFAANGLRLYLTLLPAA